QAAAEAASRTAEVSAELGAARTEAAVLHERLRAHVAQSEQAAAEAAEARHRLFATNLSVAREVSLCHAQLQTLEREKAELLIRVGGLFRNAAARRAQSVSLRLAKRLHIRKRHTDDRMLREAKAVDAFLARIEWSRIGAPSPEGRLDRVIAHLANPSISLPDLPFFQASLYLAQYPDIADADIRPLVHYVVHGQAEARDIHPLVDARHYQSRYPDVTALGLSPIEHFVMIGAEKGYDPHPLFDTRWYKQTYPDVAQSKFNPLADHLRSPFRQPHPLFDPEYYTTMYPDVVANGMNPLTHFLLLGSREGRNPNMYFDTTYYLAQNPDVASAGVNPLVHYIEKGASEGRDPHPGFNTNHYLSTYPEVAASGLNPLAHYLTVGRAENRHPLPPVALPQCHAQRDAIVMIDGLYPRPDEDSGSLDQISFIKIFRTLGYRVYFASAVEFGADSGPEVAVEEAGAICIRPPTYSSINEFLQRCGAELALCFLSRVHFGGQFKDAVRMYAPQSRIVFNTVDLHHVREKRQAEATGDADLIRRADETRRLELSLVNCVDATIVVSRQEEEILTRELPGTHVKLIPLVRDYGGGPIAPFSSRAGVAFIGSFQHKPNVDAVDYLLAEIWPAVLNKNPDLKLYIIGSHMPADMIERVVRNVSFVGYVPELDFWLSNLKLTVAPLRYGAGAKGKVVTSLSHGVPCVATPIASEGMGLVEDRDILIGRTAEALADQIVRLHASNELWDKLSTNGLALMRAEYSLASGIEKVRELLDAIDLVPPK
ncbi:Glycosyltransferase involved in cell wall bisynthesis, partial [Methylobacterium phyllostachyos]